MSKFDALELDTDKPSRLYLVHPATRQPLRIRNAPEVKEDATQEEKDKYVAWIDCYSSESPIARRHQRNVTRRRLNMRGRGKITPEELETETVELLAAISSGWNLVSLNGDKLDVSFTQENARELYGSEKLLWIREQVDEFTGERANFSPASSTS